jgi:uncharacterized lipoprotein YddW (UPF0748 family)
MFATTACSTVSQPPETRGTWLTTTANTAIASPAESAQTMARLREIGLNSVYVETWKNGYTQFPSPTLARTIGPDRVPGLGERDLLEETLIEAHRNGLLYFAWFEYGFMAAHAGTDNHLVRLKPEWLSQDRQGNTLAPNGFIWMNPLHPEVQQFLLDLVLDAVNRYDLDGVQLDDRLAWPYYTMGYDDFTRSVYASEHDGRQPPDDPRDPAWLRWRADKVTEFARKFYHTLRDASPDLLISISPGPYPWSYDNYACDWPAWAAEGLFDEYIPQVYRQNYPAFASEWTRQMEIIGARQTDLIAGIRIVGTGPDTTWPDLKQKVEATRSPRSGGHVHWFSRGVLDLYPEELKAFYQGPAAHPKRDRNWRPLPLVAARSGENTWIVQIPEDGHFRVIAKSGESWREVESRSLSAGRAELSLPEAEAVELLVDRRIIRR